MNIVWIALGLVFLTLGIVHLANAKKPRDPAAAGKSKLPATLYFVAATLFFAAAAASLFGPGE